MSQNNQFQLSPKKLRSLLRCETPFFFRQYLEALGVPFSSVIDQYPGEIQQWITETLELYAYVRDSQLRSGVSSDDLIVTDNEHSMEWWRLISRCMNELENWGSDLTRDQFAGRMRMKNHMHNEMDRIWTW